MLLCQSKLTIKLPFLWLLSMQQILHSQSIENVPQIVPTLKYHNQRHTVQKPGATLHQGNRIQHVLVIRGGSSTAKQENYEESSIKLECFLSPRVKVFNVLFLVQLLSVGLILCSSLKCIVTIGKPFKETMEQLGFTASGDGSFSPLNVLLAQQVASNLGDMLPSQHLPDLFQLSILVGALFLLLGTVLLPMWFVQLDSFTRFTRKPFSEAPKENIDFLTQKHQFVLVRLPYSERLNHNSLTIARLLSVCVGHGDVTRSNYNAGGQSEMSPAEDALLRHPSAHYFELNQRRIYVDVPTGECIDGGPTVFTDNNLNALSTSNLTSNEGLMSGLCSHEKLLAAQDRYGPYLRVKISHPQLYGCFVERLSSPLSVLKLVGQCCLLLEESLWRCLYEIGYTLFSHLRAAKKTIEASNALMKEVDESESVKGRLKVKVLRPKMRSGAISTQGGQALKKMKDDEAACNYEELKATAGDLLPGDIFIFDKIQKKLQKDGPITVPVDALLLDGSCICNEASLTGECVPQVKAPLTADHAESLAFDIFGAHRGSVIFAGAQLIRCQGSGGKKTNARFLVLRSGSYSSRGELLRHLTKSHSGRMPSEVNERDTLRLMAIMSAFGMMTCLSVVNDKSRKTSNFRKVIQCTRIAIASIPSSLPLALSSIVSSCANKLRMESDVICSAPGALVESSQISVAVFDKTGTLTADTQRLKRIVTYASPKPYPILDALLVGSHSLVYASGDSDKNSGGRVLGDPLDMACLEWAFDHGWTWDYSKHRGIFTGKTSHPTLSDVNAPVKVWQIKCFPFDSNKRMSSALILCLHSDDIFRVWKFVKGAPDSIKKLYEESENLKFSDWHDEKCRSLSQQGVRLIGTGARELDTETLECLFPMGIATLKNDGIDSKAFKKYLSVARKHAKQIDSSRVEDVECSLSFSGFACFDASIRKSSVRVVQQLKNANIDVCMLTGDGIDAALSVARETDLIAKNEMSKGVAVIDVVDGILCFAVRHVEAGDQRFRKLTTKSTRRLLKQRLALAATGEAIEEILLSSFNDSICHRLRSQLHKVSVIAQATPQIKRDFISSLKFNCRKKVLMCGDGVNDVAALRAANVGVALLNGFGKEADLADEDYDAEEERRKATSTRKKVSKSSAQGGALDMQQMRVKEKVNEAIAEIQRNCGGDNDTNSLPTFSTGDMKFVARTWWNATKQEWARARDLRRGGVAAARIIAEDAKLRKSILAKAGRASNDTIALSNDDEMNTIKPGEACLAASFTALRPSIDGVEALLRSGVAAAANAVATREMIVLESILACHSLSALYKEGVRYGKYMWPVASAIISSLYISSSAASFTPLPHLTKLRPPLSVFHPSSCMSMILQSIVHVTALSIAVRSAKSLEPAKTSNRRGFQIGRLGCGQATNGDNFLGRPPFKPNMVTNAVFLLSAFQSAAIVLVNHKGRPFYGTVLQSRALTGSILALIMFCVVCISETFPPLNAMLQLVPFPRSVKVTMLSILFLDILGSFLVERLCTFIWNRDLWKAQIIERTAHYSASGNNISTAADDEEALLHDAVKENMKMVILYAGITMCCVVHGLAKQ